MGLGTGEDLANIVANMSKDTIQQSIKASTLVAGKTAKLLLELILEKAKSSHDIIKAGKSNLQALLNSGKEIKMADIPQDDLKNFSKKSKKFGIPFAIIKEKQQRHILFKSEDIERVQRILEMILEKKLSKEQQPPVKRDIDISNPTISNVSHNKLNKENEKKTLAIQNTEIDKSLQRPSVRARLKEIKSGMKKSNIPVKVPVKER